MYLTIIFLPFIGSTISGIFGRKIGANGAKIITVFCIFLTTILTYIIFYEVSVCRSPVNFNFFNWIISNSTNFSWSFKFDDLTVSILLAVNTVSFIVHIYSCSYIEYDFHVQRFISYLSIFTGFIVLLVTGNNFLVMFVGWEGIGIASYLLISFWTSRVQAVKSAVNAITINRFGDTLLTVGLIIIFFFIQNFDYDILMSLNSHLNPTVLTIITLFLFGGAMSKSAQIPLHTWLPNAMEGPTPVSALIHAATLVTAGVYLILRCSPILEYAPTSLLIITWIGAITAVFAASVGTSQNDFKRIIAYSTCSQLGYIIFSLGLSSYNVALFHLVSHAFFKALLFLAAGAVIHGIQDQQDIRRMGGIVNFLPFIYISILIGTISLIAFPWMTGFYSKDAILEMAIGRFTISGYFSYFIGTFSAGLTAFYSFRLISITFFGFPNANINTYKNIHESSVLVFIPLFFLSIFAIFFGYFFGEIFRGVGSDFLSDSLFVHPNNSSLIDSEFSVSTFYKIFPAFFSIFSGISAFVIYNFFPNFLNNFFNVNSFGINIYKFFNQKWIIDSIISQSAIIVGLNTGIVISKIIDRGIIENIGPYGFSIVVPKIGKNFSNFDSGYITNYSLYFVIFIFSLIFIVFFPFIFNINIDFSIFLIYFFILSISINKN
jgi:NADH-ubiquinone oxidoreductase chain 5